MPINNKTTLVVVGPRPRILRTDADVVAEAVRYLQYLNSNFIPQCRLRCEESEQVLSEQEVLLSKLKEHKETPENGLEYEIKELEEEVADSLDVLNFDQDDLIYMENNLKKLSQILGLLEARSAGLDLSVRVDVGSVHVPPGIRSASYAALWETRRESQLVTANLDRACIAELRKLLSAAPLTFVDAAEEDSDVDTRFLP